MNSVLFKTKYDHSGIYTLLNSAYLDRAAIQAIFDRYVVTDCSPQLLEQRDSQGNWRMKLNVSKERFKPIYPEVLDYGVPRVVAFLFSLMVHFGRKRTAPPPALPLFLS